MESNIALEKVNRKDLEMLSPKYKHLFLKQLDKSHDKYFKCIYNDMIRLPLHVPSCAVLCRIQENEVLVITLSCIDFIFIVLHTLCFSLNKDCNEGCAV